MLFIQNFCIHNLTNANMPFNMRRMGPIVLLWIHFHPLPTWLGYLVKFCKHWINIYYYIQYMYPRISHSIIWHCPSPLPSIHIYVTGKQLICCVQIHSIKMLKLMLRKLNSINVKSTPLTHVRTNTNFQPNDENVFSFFYIFYIYLSIRYYMCECLLSRIWNDWGIG